MAELVDLVVDEGVLFDIDILARDVRLGLVVVVVRDEIFHRVVREKFPEFGAELRRKGLVVRQHQRRSVHPGDHVCHGEGLSRAGDSEEHLLLQPRLETAREPVYRLRLVARGGVGCDELKSVHLAGASLRKL